MFLLDTNVVSELRKGKSRPSAEVWRWASAVPFHLQYISVVTILEVQYGMLSIERKDKAQAAVLRTWLESVLREFQPRILSFGPVTALLCAKLHVPDKMPERDAMLAASAQEHGLTIVTRNVSDFKRTGVPLIDPWTA